MLQIGFTPPHKVNASIIDNRLAQDIEDSNISSPF